MDRRTFFRSGATAAAGAAWLSRDTLRAATSIGAEDPDFLLRGAVIYDGTGAAPFQGDIAIRGERIVAVGQGLRAPRAREVDLRGLALAPGFIDIHSHTELELLVDPRAESVVRQGVTTQVSGQCGSSPGPWDREAAARVREAYRSRYDVDIDFHDLAGFFGRLRRQGAAINLATMVGAGTVRATVVGEEDRPATAAELERMVALVSEALAAGACGLSSGLEYAPSAFADLAELVALARPLAAAGLPYATHMRNEDDELFSAVEEALAVGRQAGVPVQISHLKAQGERNWWKAAPVLGMLEAARANGVDVLYDRYPYVAYSTSLVQLFPIWAHDGGREALLARLRDPSLQPRIRAQVADKIAELGSWDAVLISSVRAESLGWARGRRLGELARERGVEPYDLLVDLTLTDEGRPGMVGFGMSEENTERILAHPLGMIGSDGSARAVAGPLAGGTPHPRNYGTFPRVLGYYCRERRIMPLETAIHKMTGMPAARLQLAGRGRIAPAAFADLVAFDPETVADRATYENPHQYPVGIPYVWVNGTLVVKEGEHTGELPGRPLRPGMIA